MPSFFDVCCVKVPDCDGVTCDVLTGKEEEEVRGLPDPVTGGGDNWAPATTVLRLFSVYLAMSMFFRLQMHALPLEVHRQLLKRVGL